MKWDYQTYCEQPDWFVDSLSEFINLEAEQQNRDMAKQKLKSK